MKNMPLHITEEVWFMISWGNMILHARTLTKLLNWTHKTQSIFITGDVVSEA
jgi:hypothetical protein